MREEARAARAQQAVSLHSSLSHHSDVPHKNEAFDLQAEMEKILIFEEKLRHAGSAVLYPNILAAKWKERWERERRHAALSG